jgi:hypothetical protein
VKTFLFFLFFNLLFSLAGLLAHEEILSVTDNDDNNEVYNLVVEVDDTTQRLKELYKDTYLSGNKIRRDNLNPLELKNPDGMILEKRGEHNVLSLKSDNYDHDRGGTITIDSLYNGISGERRSVDLELSKDKTSWRLFKDHKVVSKFHVKVNRVIIIGVVGIKKIIME